MRRGLALLVLLAAWPAVGADRGMVWKVSGPHGALYLAGSVHLLPGSDPSLPPPYQQAYAASARLVLEVDLAALDPGALQALVAELALLPPERHIHDLLSADGAARFDRGCAARALPCAALVRFEPWSAALTALALEAARAGFASEQGVDFQLAGRALEDGRALLGLETAADQLRALDALPPALQERFLLEVLDQGPELAHDLAALVAAWRRGDLAAVERLALEIGEEPALAEALFARRHARWLPQLEALASDGTATLVVVGAAHLVGEHSLLRSLRARGYRIERVGARR